MIELVDGPAHDLCCILSRPGDAHERDAGGANAEMLRGAVMCLGAALGRAIKALDAKKGAGKDSSRSCHLQLLAELIKPVPRPWQEEWMALALEENRIKFAAGDKRVTKEHCTAAARA